MSALVMFRAHAPRWPLQRALCSSILMGSLVLGAVTDVAAAPTSSSSRDISASATDGGWELEREAVEGEERAILTYSYGGYPPREVIGVKRATRWTFAISEPIPIHAMVSVEVRTFSKLSSPESQKAAEEVLRAFVVSLKDTTVSAFQEAAKRAGEKPSAEVIWLAFKPKVRAEAAALLKKSPLGGYYFQQRPAIERVMKDLGFEKLGPDQWEPTERTFVRFRAFHRVNGRRLVLVRDTLAGKPPEHSCAAALGPSSRADAEEALLRCWRDFAKAASDAAKGATTPNTKAKETQSAVLLEIGKLEAARTKKGDDLVAGAPSDDKLNTSAEPIARQYSEAFPLIIEKLAALGVDESTLNTLDAARRGIAYAASLRLQEPLEAELWASIVERDWKEAEVAKTFSYLGEARQLFTLEPGKARFFLSTGVLATSLDSEWKLSLPVMASICFAATGCETKGTGVSSIGAEYVSLDLGVKAIFLGEKDAREGAPSFLLGLGITPLYATHFSIGLNAFENRQTEKANVALYVSVTLDLIDGADILGGLGMGKPKLSPIGDTENKGK